MSQEKKWEELLKVVIKKEDYSKFVIEKLELKQLKKLNDIKFEKSKK